MIKYDGMRSSQNAYTFKYGVNHITFDKDHYHCWLTNGGTGFKLVHMQNNKAWDVDILNKTIHEVVTEP